MPQIPYTVTFPDGGKVTFTGPDSMNDVDVQTRAIQERGVKEGSIPTSFWSGASKQLGSDKTTTGALMAGAGMLTGGPIGAAAVAASPFVAEAIKYGTTGEAPSTADIATDAAASALSFGPYAFSKAGGALAGEVAKLPGSTLPQALAKGTAKIVGPLAHEAEALTPQAVGETSSEIWEAMKQAAVRMKAGVTADDVELMRESVAKGMKPSMAARIVGGKDLNKMSALMNLYLRPFAGLK